MAELPKPPSLDLESGELEPIMTGDSGDSGDSELAFDEPIEIPSSPPKSTGPKRLFPEKPEEENPAETTLDGLEPIDINESGPVELPKKREPAPVAARPVASTPLPDGTAGDDATPVVPSPTGPKPPTRSVMIPENPDAPRDVPPPTITGGESRFEMGERASSSAAAPTASNTSPQAGVARALNGLPSRARASGAARHDETDEVPSALLNPTSVVGGASAAATPPPSAGLVDTPQTGTPAPEARALSEAGPAFSDTMIDIDHALPAQGLTDASASAIGLGGETDEIIRETHHEITAKTDDVMAETIDEVLQQSTEQALRLANVVDDVEKLGGSVASLRAEMSGAVSELQTTLQSLRANAPGPVTVSGQPAMSDVERLRDAMNQRLDAIEDETAQKLKRQGTFQSVQMILLLALLVALGMLIFREPPAAEMTMRPAQKPSPVKTPDIKPLEEVEEAAEEPTLQPVEGEPPATPEGRAVPIGRGDEDPNEKRGFKKKRRRRKRPESRATRVAPGSD